MTRLRPSSSFIVETLTQQIGDLKAKATRFRTMRSTTPGMAAECAAIAEALEEGARTIMGHLAEATGR